MNHGNNATHIIVELSAVVSAADWLSPRKFLSGKSDSPSVDGLFQQAFTRVCCAQQMCYV